RADLWAVGVILYELLTCRTPYRGESIGHMLQSLALSEPDPIRAHYPNATPALEHFFARVLVRDRSRRYMTAREMSEALACVSLGDDEPPARIPSTKSGWVGVPSLASGTGTRGGTDVYAATVAPGAPPPPASAARPAMAQNAQTLDTHAASAQSVGRNVQTS